MDRREFFQNTLIATLAGSVLGDSTLARAQQAQATAAAPPTPRHLILDAYSRYLHWLRTADEVAEAAIELTCEGVNPTVQAYPGHIDSARVAQDMPPFVNRLRSHGLRVKQIRGPEITDASAPNLEAIVGTMGQLGITHYWIGTDRYDLTKPILPQLDEVKTRVEKFVKLNQKHNTTLMYHTRAGAESVGSVVWDLLYVLKDFDPKYVGIHWDTGHMSHHGSNMWELLMRTAGPYVVGMSWKDRSWEQNTGLLGEGGPYPGPQLAAAAAGRGRGAGGGRGGPAGGPAGRGRAGGGGGPAGPGVGAPGAAGAPPMAEADGGPGGPPGGGRGAGRGGGGGRGGDARALPLPLAGTFARGGGWTSPSVPMGQGLVDIPRYAAVLRDLGFNGPMELEAEYPIGGPNNGADKLTLPPEQVLGALKRDVLTIRAAFLMSGTGLTV
jgi:sugar phosphate isomerase/epimerase